MHRAHPVSRLFALRNGNGPPNWRRLNNTLAASNSSTTSAPLPPFTPTQSQSRYTAESRIGWDGGPHSVGLRFKHAPRNSADVLAAVQYLETLYGRVDEFYCGQFSDRKSSILNVRFRSYASASLAAQNITSHHRIRAPQISAEVANPMQGGLGLDILSPLALPVARQGIPNNTNVDVDIEGVVETLESGLELEPEFVEPEQRTDNGAERKFLYFKVFKPGFDIRSPPVHTPPTSSTPSNEDQDRYRPLTRQAMRNLVNWSGFVELEPLPSTMDEDITALLLGGGTKDNQLRSSMSEFENTVDNMNTLVDTDTNASPTPTPVVIDHPHMRFVVARYARIGGISSPLEFQVDADGAILPSSASAGTEKIWRRIKENPADTSSSSNGPSSLAESTPDELAPVVELAAISTSSASPASPLASDSGQPQPEPTSEPKIKPKSQPNPVVLINTPEAQAQLRAANSILKNLGKGGKGQKNPTKVQVQVTTGQSNVNAKKGGKGKGKPIQKGVNVSAGTGTQKMAESTRKGTGKDNVSSSSSSESTVGKGEEAKKTSTSRFKGFMGSWF